MHVVLDDELRIEDIPTRAALMVERHLGGKADPLHFTTAVWHPVAARADVECVDLPGFADLPSVLDDVKMKGIPAGERQLVIVEIEFQHVEIRSIHGEPLDCSAATSRQKEQTKAVCTGGERLAVAPEQRPLNRCLLVPVNDIFHFSLCYTFAFSKK